MRYCKRKSRCLIYSVICESCLRNILNYFRLGKLNLGKTNLNDCRNKKNERCERFKRERRLVDFINNMLVIASPQKKNSTSSNLEGGRKRKGVPKLIWD